MDFSSWEQSFRYLVQQARSMPAYPAELRDNAHEVTGCEAKVWLAVDTTNPTQVQVRMDSESRIVKGLLALLLEQTDGQSSAAIAEFDSQRYFAEIGLAKHLSPSRTNGLYQVCAALRAKVMPAS
ncbi:MAG: SufE family protein [Idiomarina sp.]